MNSPRHIAVKMLKDIIDNKKFFSEIKLTYSNLSSQDLAFTNMLVLTTLRHLVFIKKTLKRFIKKKLPSNTGIAQYALQTATAEILYLNTPEYAVINTWVELVKKETNKYIAGFINAVLRNICKQKHEIQKADIGEFFPPEFFRILNQDYGKKTIQKIQSSAAIEPPLDISVKEDPKQWAQKLGGKTLPNGTVRLKNNGKIPTLEGYEQGFWWVQDFAASLAVKSMGNIKGQNILDLCAAPGGKTAQLINAGANVTALDISEQRLKTLKENLNRLNFNAEVMCSDALEFLNSFNSQPFDAILLDAPCSATGTIRRHPELVHIKTLKDIEKQAIIQKKILELTKNALKKDGILIYCTCSIAKAEGENIINEFLSSHPDFILIPIDASELSANNELSEIITSEGYIRTLPQHLSEHGGSDAFFIARLKKVA